MSYSSAFKRVQVSDIRDIIMYAILECIIDYLHFAAMERYVSSVVFI